MIITKTPFRMSFFGGGTDIPEFFKETNGSVISTTFDKYCYVNVRQLPNFFNYKTELSYSVIEQVNDIESIKHPAIRNAMKMLNIKDIRLGYEADLPSRSGLGTSSSFAVGMLNAFHIMKNEKPNKKKLADEAIHLERILCQEDGGWQDQIAAAFGGFNRIDFDENGYTVKKLPISIERKRQLNNNLLMFFTGFTRFSSEIQKNNTKTNRLNKIEWANKMIDFVNKAEKVIVDDSIDLDEFGDLLNKSWELKKLFGSSVSNTSIDQIYDRGIQAGAIGGKLLGAGGGGFIIFYVPNKYQNKVKKELSDLLYVPFKFEDEGTQVLYSNLSKED